jgi:DNA-binding SARP family transcriptional activator
VLDFRILGPLEVLDRGTTPLALGGQKQRALLALLLLNAGKVVSTDRLIDELWAGEPPRTAATSLQNLVSGLRKLLGREHVVTRPSGRRAPSSTSRSAGTRSSSGARSPRRAAPLRERLRGQLMLALYRTGRQAEALTAYRDARQALVDELGIEPSPALQRLQAAILRQEAGLEPSSADAADDDHSPRSCARLRLAGSSSSSARGPTRTATAGIRLDRGGL